MTQYTIKDALDYIRIHKETLLATYRDCALVPEEFRKGEQIELHATVTGWLSAMAIEHGATAAEAFALTLSHVIRSVKYGPYASAVHTINEYLRTGKVPDEPGLEVATQALTELLEADEEAR